jgi:hypothetical protein
VFLEVRLRFVKTPARRSLAFTRVNGRQLVFTAVNWCSPMSIAATSVHPARARVLYPSPARCAYVRRNAQRSSGAARICSQIAVKKNCAARISSFCALRVLNR